MTPEGKNHRIADEPPWLPQIGIQIATAVISIGGSLLFSSLHVGSMFGGLQQQTTENTRAIERLQSVDVTPGARVAIAQFTAGMAQLSASDAAMKEELRAGQRSQDQQLEEIRQELRRLEQRDRAR